MVDYNYIYDLSRVSRSVKENSDDRSIDNIVNRRVYYYLLCCIINNVFVAFCSSV